MKRGMILTVILCLFCTIVFAEETPRWAKSQDVTTAATFTAKWDVDNSGDDAGETRGYKNWTVLNVIETTDAVYCDADSHDVAGTMTQNTAVNDGSRSTSVKIPAGTIYTFSLLSARTTISCICTAAATCSAVEVIASTIR